MVATGVELVQVADPIDVDIDSIIALAPRNVVIAVDADVEDVFDRFDGLLAADAYRVLIEEAAVVAARGGWDMARWSRHLAAKLLGHDNVLPEGFEPDEDAAGDRTGESVVSVSEPDVLEFASFAESDTAKPEVLVAPVDAVADADADLLELAPFTQPAESQAPIVGVVVDADTDTLELAPYGDSDVVAPASILTSDDIGNVLPDASQWSQYQDFEVRSDLPAANLDRDVWAGYADALAADSGQDIAPEEALQRISEDIESFDTGAQGDRWQDFERPVPEQESNEPADAGASRLAGRHESWSLEEAVDSNDSTAGDGDAERLQAIEAAISSLSLVDQDDDGSAAQNTVGSLTQAGLSTDGMVLVLGGLGGPDPLRQILQQLPSVFPAPLLVQQSLDGGHYDRLVRQIARNSQLPVELASAGMAIEDSHAYILPQGIGIKQQGIGDWQFVETGGRGFADVLSALPAVASAAVVLSGTSEDNVEPLLRFLQSGGQVLAQAGEGCYDHAVPGLMGTRGAKMDQPVGLVTRLNLLWPSMEPK